MSIESRQKRCEHYGHIWMIDHAACVKAERELILNTFEALIGMPAVSKRYDLLVIDLQDLIADLRKRP